MSAPSSPAAPAPSGGSRPVAASTTSRARLRRTWLERIVIAVGVTATMLAFSAAGILALAVDKIGDIAVADFEEGIVERADPGEPSNWLLVGSDSREGIDPNDPNAAVFLGPEAPDGKRTDTMIVARVDPDAETIDLLSIPRDLYVPIAGAGQSRINSAFNGEGGEQRLVQTIEEYFGFEINHYAEIDFIGFKQVVDALGGVNIWFDRPMRDAGSGLNVTSAGCQLLDGWQALAFARARNLQYFEDGSWRTDGTGDLGRTTRQQYFINRVAATATSKLDITNILTINNLLDAGGSNLTIDGGVSPDDLLGLAQTFASLTDDQIIGHSLPTFDFRAPNNAAVLGLMEEEAQPILAIFRGEARLEAGAAVAAPISVDYRVLNGSGTPGQAGEIAALLGTAGLPTGTIDNAPAAERTTIVYGPGLEAAAERLARYVNVTPVFELDQSIDDVALVSGSDWAGVRAEPLPEGSVAPPAPTTTAPPAAAPEAAAPEDTLPGVVPGPTPEGTACE